MPCSSVAADAAEGAVTSLMGKCGQMQTISVISKLKFKQNGMFFSVAVTFPVWNSQPDQQVFKKAALSIHLILN